MNSCLETAYFNTECPHELLCPICLQFMLSPTRISCGHVFGASCLEKWKKKECPLCRQQYLERATSTELKIQTASYEAICKDCHSTIPAQNVPQHLKSCKLFLERKRESLKIWCKKQRQIIGLQITPHLLQAHEAIYKQYVDEWRWLESDGRDWKWWWWSSNPWWGNTSCKKCNQLWHKYEDEIDIVQTRRVEIINQQGVRCIAQE